MYVYVVDSENLEVKRRHVSSDAGLYWNVNLHTMSLLLAKDGSECPHPRFPYRAFSSRRLAHRICKQLKYGQLDKSVNHRTN